MIRIGAAALVAVAIAVAVAWGSLQRGNDYIITGHFLSAEGVTAGNDVVMSGVPVGKVESVEVAPDSDSTGGALIRMRFDKRYVPLRRGTRATLRRKGFLSNMYVDLTPGPDRNRAIPAWGELPISDTAAPVELDQVMDMFDPDTRARLKTLTLEGGRSLADRGSDVNHVLAELPDISANFAHASGNLDQSQDQLDRLATEFDRITRQMASEDIALRGSLRNGAGILDSIAAREDRLQAEITYANSGLGKANAGLSGHERDLAQLLLEIPDLQDRLKKLSASADPALVDLNMCYPDIINAIAGLRSSTGYRHPAGSQDANGYELRVQSFIAPAMIASNGSLHPPVAACQGGTPTP